MLILLNVYLENKEFKFKYIEHYLRFCTSFGRNKVLGHTEAGSRNDGSYLYNKPRAPAEFLRQALAVLLMQSNGYWTIIRVYFKVLNQLNIRLVNLLLIFIYKPHLSVVSRLNADYPCFIAACIDNCLNPVQSKARRSVWHWWQRLFAPDRRSTTR